MAGNGDAQRLVDKLEVALRGDPQPVEDAANEFTLERLSEFFVAHGKRKREITDKYGEQMLEMLRRELAYVEKFVGKMPK